MSINQSQSLSLVVTAYSTERLNDIYELLESVKNQTCKNMETIFVVERSQALVDKINAFVAENSIPNMIVVFSNDKLGLSAARNLGIKQAKGEIIAFVDDDVVLYPDWAEEMIKSLENDSAIVGVTGSAFPLWENESLKWLPEEFYWLISCTAWTGWKEPRIVRGVFGANMGFKREAFDDGDLFAPNTGYDRASQHQPVSDDLEFSLRVRKKARKSIVFSPSLQVWHRVYKKRLGWKFIMARSYQIGCTRRIIKKYYAEEMGPFEQEQHVLRGTFGILWKIPKELFTRPSFACKKLCLIFIVLSSAAIGYLVPIPAYSPIKQKVVKP